jgi:glycine dehydrogenase subunit 2
MDEVTLQPAAGARASCAGVLMIRAYHLARGERRHKVLIPDSATAPTPRRRRWPATRWSS